MSVCEVRETRGVTTKLMLDVRPLTPTIGAEIRGIDCSADLDDATIAAIRAVWLEHLVVFFPDQQLTNDTQLEFAARFGEPTVGHPVEKTVEENPSIQPIDSVKDRTNFWHTDVTFMSRPPTASLLRAVVLPEAGGDTMWADTRAAFDSLAEPFQRFCEQLTAIHYDPYYAALVQDGQGNEWEGKKLTTLRPAQHPVVRVHPETGRRNLFVNPQFTVGLKDFPGPQSAALLRVLYDHMTQPEFIVRYRWTPGTLAMWDNRTTMHFGIYDYGDARRIMHRVILRGERPAGVGAADAPAG
jgi:taurine dioxygenase